MTIQEIKHPTQAQYDWADLNMFRLERRALKDSPVKVLNAVGVEPEVEGVYPLSVVCQAIIANFTLDELAQRKGFPNV